MKCQNPKAESTAAAWVVCDWLAGDKEGLNEMRGERVCGGLCTDGGYSISSIQTEPGVGGVDRSSWNVNNPSVDSRRPVCLPWCGQDAEFLGTSWKVCFNHSGFNNLAFWEKHRSYWALCVRFPSLFPEFTWVSSFFFLFFFKHHFCTAYGQHNGNVLHFRGARFDSFSKFKITANVMTHPHRLFWEESGKNSNVQRASF